ncbi:MAG: hypothetical protein ACI9V1_000594 [Spirosomataceae bacterium]|jgi:hypothetical protein
MNKIENLNLLEKVGIGLGIIGAIMIFMNLYVINSLFEEVLAFDEMIFWIGVLLWALGYMRSQAAEKKKNNE